MKNTKTKEFRKRFKKYCITRDEILENYKTYTDEELCEKLAKAKCILYEVEYISVNNRGGGGFIVNYINEYGKRDSMLDDICL